MKSAFLRWIGWGLDDMCQYGDMFFTRRWAQSVTYVHQAGNAVIIHALETPYESRITSVNTSENFARVIEGYAHYTDKEPNKTA